MKPDLTLKLANGELAHVTAKSSKSEHGSAGHAGRVKLSELSGMGIGVLAMSCLRLISVQEYCYSAKSARESAFEGAKSIPAKRLAQKGLVGSLLPAPGFAVILLSGGNSPRALAGPVAALLEKADEFGVELCPPKAGDAYASAGFGYGLFTIKRSGGTAENDLQLTISTLAAAKLFDAGSLPGWGQAKMGRKMAR